MVHAVAKTDQLQGSLNILAPLSFGELGQQQRQLDVFEGSQHRNEIECLKDVADVTVAPTRQLALAQFRQVGSQYIYFAFRAAVDSREQIQQSRLARTAGAHESQKVALLNIKIDLVERHNFKTITRETLANIANLYHWC